MSPRRRPAKQKLVIDTNIVVAGIRAFRPQPPEETTLERRLLDSWIEDEETFDWLYSEEILDEYRDVLRRLKVPPNVTGRFVNLLSKAGVKVKVYTSGSFSPDKDDDIFYYCALDGDADLIVTNNTKDFPPVEGRKHPKIVKTSEALELIFR